MAHFAVWNPSENERENILSQHKEVYNGYQTLNPAAMAKVQPLYTQDFANDKGGITVNNKGEVKKYTNVGINESVNESEGSCNECGGMMYEGECMECGYMNEQTNGQDLEKIKDINPKAHVDYIEEEGETEEQYDAVEPAYQFQSHGPEDVYGTLHDYDKEHPHHDYDSMEDVEKYDPSDDISSMFDVSDGFAFRDEPSDTFQYDAGDIDRMGDEGLGQDTENDMDLGKSEAGYNFYSGGSEGGESYPDTEDMEDDEWEDLTEAKSERKQILEMMQRMKRFM